MKLGYNTNGLAHHRLLDAIDLLAEVGFQSVAITLDAGALDPFSDPDTLRQEARRVRERLDHHALNRVVETGARYLLNPRNKHDPTLLDPDPARRDKRADFLRRAIEIAQWLDAPIVSIWSGKLPEPIDANTAMERLVDALLPVLDSAERAGKTIGFEPEPGMFIESLAQYAELADRVNRPHFRLTMDVGHVHCTEEPPVARHVHQWGAHLVNVHIEDAVRGIHEHLPFGEGTMEFAPILQALHDVGYRGGVHVELSRDSHRAAEAVVASYNFLAPLVRDLVNSRP